MSFAPLARQLEEMLDHKLVNVVIQTVVYAVDVG
jgi:hypothetical protein